jgi:hypothetical protein
MVGMLFQWLSIDTPQAVSQPVSLTRVWISALSSWFTYTCLTALV